MAIFEASNRRTATPHLHVAGDHCPWCDQPIPHGKFEEITRRIEKREREQHEVVQRRLKDEFAREAEALRLKAEATVEEARAQAAAAAEQRVLAARQDAKQQAEAVMLARLGDAQTKLAEAEQTKAAVQQQMAAVQAQMTALKEAQEQAFNARLQEARDTLQQERDLALLAEKAKAFEEHQKLQAKVQDLQRQLEGKSAHELGEGSEIDLFEQLREAFENDRIRRVAKGVNGADVIHEVVHNGKVCGKIIYDAKNRNAWQNEFASKLRADKLAEGAEHAILSSNKFPRDRQQVHFQDGVIVANPARVLALVDILRGQVVRMHELRASEQERGQKTDELYAFITSEHFKQLLEQVEAQTGKMVELDGKEQEAHRRIWDQRSKLIRAVQKARGDLAFEVDRIIGTAGNGADQLELD
jgi:hypothetical protein